MFFRIEWRDGNAFDKGSKARVGQSIDGFSVAQEGAVVPESADSLFSISLLFAFSFLLPFPLGFAVFVVFLISCFRFIL